MLKQSHAISEELIEWRRDFHMHPEIGFELHRTSKIVADELEKMGYRVRRGVGKTGVVSGVVQQPLSLTQFSFEHGCSLNLKILKAQ